MEEKRLDRRRLDDYRKQNGRIKLREVWKEKNLTGNKQRTWIGGRTEEEGEAWWTPIPKVAGTRTEYIKNLVLF